MNSGGTTGETDPFYLVGAHADRTAIGQVRTLLGGHGVTAIVSIWSKASNSAATPLRADPAPAMLFCWSATSVSLDYATLHALARRLDREGRYRGVTLDGASTPPGLVSHTVAQLSAVLVADGPAQFEHLRPVTPGDGDPLRKPIATVRRWKHRLITIPSVGAAMSLLLILWAYASGIESTCKIGWLREPCRLAPGSGIPWWSEEAAWETIATGNRCEAFAGYLNTKGRDAPYAAEARHRLDMAVPLASERAVNLALTAPEFDQTLRRNKTDAIADAHNEAEAAARAQCARAATNFAGEIAPGTFKPDRPAHCSPAPAGWVCTLSGVAACRFKVTGEHHTCAPPPR